MKDNVKAIITLISIFLVFLLVMAILSKKDNSDKLMPVDMPELYFMAHQYNDNYINEISNKNYNKVYDILYSSYIEQKDITETNIQENINNYPIGTFTKINNISYFIENNIYVFYINSSILKGKDIFDEEKNNIIDDDFNSILLVDNNNHSFAIYPTTKKNYKKDLNSIKIKNVSISNNNSNEILALEPVSKEKMCILYLTDFIDKFYNSEDKGYNLLSDEMLEKYGSIDSYTAYINKSHHKITAVADKCAVEIAKGKNKNNKKYTVIDKYNNIFIFTEKAIMDYKVDIKLNN